MFHLEIKVIDLFFQFKITINFIIAATIVPEDSFDNPVINKNILVTPTVKQMAKELQVNRI
jgi:hypothetical protein